jgi:glycosyltransferase involved in cell wall biosynthesis
VSLRPLRVLTVVDLPGTTGGAERFAHELTIHLDRSRFEPAICVTRWDRAPEHEPALAELREAEVPFIGLERRSRYDVRPWWRLTRRMREWGVDVVHAHKFGSNVWGSLLAPRMGASVFIAHEQTWSWQGEPVRRLIDRRLIAHRADAFVAVSRADQRRMTEIEKVPPSKTRLIHNGIAFEPSADSPAEVRARLGLDPDQSVIGVVAKLRRQKALDVLLRAVALAREQIPSLTALLVGGPAPPEGDEEERLLRSLAGELGLADHVRFLGDRPDVPDLLAALDVAVLSSDYEGTPLSVMEYMAAGKPVVATRVGGVPEVVEDGVTGVLVEPRDPAALAAAVVGLVSDGERAVRMGEAGRERQRREFSIEAATGKAEALYEELYRAKSKAG